MKLLISLTILLLTFNAEETRLETCTTLYQKGIDNAFKIVLKLEKNKEEVTKDEMKEAALSIAKILTDCHKIKIDMKNLDKCIDSFGVILPKVKYVLSLIMKKDYTLAISESISLGVIVPRIIKTCRNQKKNFLLI